MKKLFILSFTIIFMILLINCEKENQPTVWDPDDKGAPTPAITEVQPPDVSYGAVGEKKLVTISGENFNPEPDKNMVYFGNMEGTVTEASENELKVIPPANYKDSLLVKVAVHKAYAFGKYGDSTETGFSPHYYKLKQPYQEVGNYSDSNPPGAICVDGNGNLLVKNGETLEKVKGDKVIQLGELRTSNELTQMVMGPNNTVFYTFAKFILRTDTTDFSHEYSRLDYNGKDIVFDNDQNMFVISENAIYEVNTEDLSMTNLLEKEDTTFNKASFYNGELYLTGSYDSETYLWKASLNQSEIGSLQELKNISQTEYSDVTINDIMLNSQGMPYLATNEASILYIENGSMEQLYPDILGPHVAYSAVWGTGEEIFINTMNNDEPAKTKVLKVNVFEEGAEQYGREK